MSGNAALSKTSATTEGADIFFPSTQVLVKFFLIFKLDHSELPQVGLPTQDANNVPDLPSILILGTHVQYCAL